LGQQSNKYARFLFTKAIFPISFFVSRNLYIVLPINSVVFSNPVVFAHKQRRYKYYEVQMGLFANHTTPNHYFHNNKSAYTCLNVLQYVWLHYAPLLIHNNDNTHTCASHPVFFLPRLATCFFPASQQE